MTAELTGAWAHRGRVRLLAAALACGIGATGVFAQADTSSWSSGTMTNPKDRIGEPKLLKADPTKKPSKPQPPTSSPAAVSSNQNALKFEPPSRPVSPNQAGQTSQIAKATDDGAYEAFDQGKYLTALELARAAAEKDDAVAHTLVGRIYLDGLGVTRDAVLAAKWFRRGAELGDPEAMFAFGLMLADGTGIQKDRKGAAQMFEEASQRGHALANYNLALLFLRGDGKPENPERAAMHLEFAASRGVAPAQYDLAALYVSGLGVKPNAYKASILLEQAADAGYPDAEVEFGVWLFQGRGVTPSQSRGVLYFRAAAEKGVMAAQTRLARCYFQGAGVPADAVEGAKWYLVARSNGLNDPDLEKVFAKLAKPDRAKAEQAAAEWADRARL